MNSPTNDDWKRLYEAAAQFKGLTPWTWMGDHDLFAVESPEDSEMGYCTVMGSGGMEFGLAVFLGDQGLDSYRRLMAGELSPESAEMGAMPRSLSVLFVDRQFLQRRDHETIRSLGLRFRGRNNWPLFRSQLPGYAPWYLSQGEAIFLASALQSAVEVSRAVADGSVDLAEGPARGQVYMLRTGAGELKRTWEALPAPSPARATPKPDVSRLQRLKARAKSLEGPLAVDWFLLPAMIAGETERPYFPLAFVAMRTDGFVLGIEALKPWATDEERQEALVRLLEKAAVVPSGIVVPGKEGYRLAQGVGDALGCRVNVRQVPGLDSFKQEMMGFLR